MPRQISLNTGGTITLDANGGGQVALGPNIPGVAWNVTTVATSGSSMTNIPTLQVYSPVVAPNYLLGGTYSGTLDSDDISITVWYGQQIVGVYAGGDPGASATLSINGTASVPGN